jgi:dihydropteroate synthase
MAYVLNVNPSAASDGKATFESQTRKDAIEKAVGLIGQGCQNVTIADENGKTFTSTQFGQFLEDGEE